MRSATTATNNVEKWTHAFALRKVGTALFFMEHVLRPAASLAPTFIAGEGEFELEDSAGSLLLGFSMVTGGIG